MDDIPILYEDRYLLALNKPAGLSSESGSAPHPSAEVWALEYLRRTTKRQQPYLRVAHRLDRVSSGVLLLAKTKTALQHLMQQFEARMVVKVYVAQVVGDLPAESGLLTHYLGRSADGHSAVLSETPFEGGQPAVCRYRLLERLEGLSLVELTPKTGRFHQLRAQMAFIGCPIVGDERYGGPPWRLHAIRLHALRLQVHHPLSQAALSIEAPLPADWTALEGYPQHG
ncbi:MAG: RluA family pseudouridine synthase [Saprospiraceae bacterium]|nr:RluA family pseudouridine synthase [Saprospiraceae bacterium]MDW8228856.1 RluA family pseudouridine synthase [Saprospiraceae bacterium]